MSVSLSKIPSIDLLRGFVAVGRRMSITQAATDLFLTQSAVSRQVHGLETALGVKLFDRVHRAIRFTPEGERLFLVADSVMQQLQDAIGALAGSQRPRPAAPPVLPDGSGRRSCSPQPAAGPMPISSTAGGGRPSC